MEPVQPVHTFEGENSSVSRAREISLARAQ